MRIKNIALYKYNRPFSFDFNSCHTKRKTSESIILKLTFNNGVIGYGESSPRAYVTHEDQASVVRTIKHCFSHLISSMEINSIDDIEELLNELENECRRKKISHYNSALGAVDIALLDALGKRNQLPVSTYLGASVEKDFSYSISIPMISLDKIRKFFHLFKNQKFNSIKIVLGTDEDKNLDRVKLIRELFGEKADLRVEANGKLTYEQVISNLEKMEQFNLSAIEQPAATNDFRGLKQIKQNINLAVIVDESVCCLSDAQKLIEHDACDILNIKISKCGGLLRSKKIADYAKSRNIRCQMGAHVGETEILYLAGKHFATTTPELVYFEGVSFLLFKDLFGSSEISYTEQKDIPTQASFNGLGISEEARQSIFDHCIPIPSGV